LLRAAAACGAGRPQALDAFLAAHPHAQRCVDTPQPIPTSVAREAFFAGTAFTCTNANGVRWHGRFRLRPDTGTAYLSNAEAVAQSADCLVDAIGPRLAQEPVRRGVCVHLAAPGDDVADARVPWPDRRPESPCGTITLTARVDDQVPDRRRIIFDPVPRVEGIEASGDPRTDVRADLYLLSGRRRRAVFGDGRR
jgi:catalase